MLTPLQYNHLCDEIAGLYAGLENSIIEDMTKRIVRMGYVSDSSAWQANMLMEAGMLYEDILAEIALKTGQTDRQVRELFRSAGIQSVRNDNFYYRQAGLVVPRNMSDSALQMLEAGYQKCSGSLKNLTLTTASTSQQAFMQACNLAYMQTSSGMMDYQTAVRRAVQNAAGNGSAVRYPSGHVDKLDVAVRRAVLTGVGQTIRQLSFQNANDMECDLMEITAHAGARPSHAEWQGQIVSLSGRRGYLTPDDIGYGTVDGFGGVNCRHDWHPFFENFSERAYSDERLKELKEHVIQIDGKNYHDYEVSQMQRYYERKIREKKRQVIAAKAHQDNTLTDADAAAAAEEFQKRSVQLKKAEQKLKDFLKQTGFLNDSSRTWVNGFGRSEAQKAVWANRKYQQSKKSTASKAPASKLSGGSGSSINVLTNTQGSDTMKMQGKYSDLGTIKERLRNDKRVDAEYYSTIKERFSHGSKNAKKAFTKFVPSDSVANSSFEGTAHYDDRSTKKVYMHYFMDLNNVRGAGATWFHEHGHLIDDAAGNISNDRGFRKLIHDDYRIYLESYAKIHKIENINVVYQAIGNDLSEMRNHSAVADLINAVSEDKIRGIAWHPPEYWRKDDALLCAEAFAHMFEAQFDSVRYKEMQKYFPNALKKFEEILEVISK